MAEGWTRALAAGDVVVRSGGTEPRHVHPLAIRAMQESGVDISEQRGKALKPLLAERFELVVTLCESAAAAMPPLRVPTRRIHRPFEDPTFLAPDDDLDLDVFRALRDELRAFVLESVIATRA